MTFETSHAKRPMPRIILGLGGVLEKLRSASAELGFVNAILYGIDQALDRPGGFAVKRYALVAQPLAEKRRLPARRGASIAVRDLDRDDPALAGLPLDGAVLDYRFGQGAVCLGAFKDARVIGCVWFCLGPYDEDEVRCRFVPAPGVAAWDFDFYLAPEQRGGIAFARLWDAADAYLAARGVRWTMSRISKYNSASLASHARLGARPVGDALFLRLGRWQLTIASLAPYVHLSRSRGPVLRLPLPDEGGTRARR